MEMGECQESKKVCPRVDRSQLHGAQAGTQEMACWWGGREQLTWSWTNLGTHPCHFTLARVSRLTQEDLPDATPDPMGTSQDFSLRLMSEKPSPLILARGQQPLDPGSLKIPFY